MIYTKFLWILGSSIFIILGAIHLFYTFFTRKFYSRNEVLNSDMRSHSPILTRATSIWKAWIGFNASHSTGAIFIGVMNVFMAYYYFDSLVNTLFFFGFNIITVLFYLWLAKTYWFKIPFIGILITLICFVLSAILSLEI